MKKHVICPKSNSIFIGRISLIMLLISSVAIIVLNTKGSSILVQRDLGVYTVSIEYGKENSINGPINLIRFSLFKPQEIVRRVISIRVEKMKMLEFKFFRKEQLICLIDHKQEKFLLFADANEGDFFVYEIERKLLHGIELNQLEKYTTIKAANPILPDIPVTEAEN